MFYNISQCFRSVSWCFTMFNNVSRCLVNHAMIGIAASVTAHLTIAATPQGSAITPQKSAITPQKSAMMPQGSWMETGVALFLEDNFQSCCVAHLITAQPAPGLENVLISPWLVTLLHICGVIPTPQSPISPVTPRDYRRRRAERRHLRIERRYRLIEWPLRDRRRHCHKRRRLHIERRRLRIERWYRRIEWLLFHGVSQCFKSVSWCFTSGAQYFTCVSWCFTMFNNVLWCLARSRRSPQGSLQCRRDRR